MPVFDVAKDKEGGIILESGAYRVTSEEARGTTRGSATQSFGSDSGGCEFHLKGHGSH